MAGTPQIESKDNRIVLHFETLDQALQLLSPWKDLRHRKDAAEQITKALSAIGLCLEIKVKGRQIAEFVAGKIRGPIVALLGPQS